MNLDANAQPLPTPYDIVAIPSFPEPSHLTGWLIICGIILTGVLFTFLIYEKKNKKKTAASIRKILAAELSETLSSPLITKKAFALCWKKFLRTVELLKLPADASTLCEEANLLLFGKEFSSDSAMKVLQEAKSFLEQSRWEA